MSAKTLERTIGTSYQVAWMMLQRFRVAMVNSERKPLSDNVEVDETYVGGAEKGGKFCFNRRTSRSRGLVFRRLLEQAVVTGPITETDVIGGYDWGE
ncbi:MAG: hypothetical protein DDT19_02828 [Syntrophomonadaceae bacterium]|nr:hypothetical protein [Bacillota bacterium]